MATTAAAGGAAAAVPGVLAGSLRIGILSLLHSHSGSGAHKAGEGSSSSSSSNKSRSCWTPMTVLVVSTIHTAPPEGGGITGAVVSDGESSLPILFDPSSVRLAPPACGGWLRIQAAGLRSLPVFGTQRLLILLLASEVRVVPAPIVSGSSSSSSSSNSGGREPTVRLPAVSSAFAALSLPTLCAAAPPLDAIRKQVDARLRSGQVASWDASTAARHAAPPPVAYATFASSLQPSGGGGGGGGSGGGGDDSYTSTPYTFSSVLAAKAAPSPLGDDGPSFVSDDFFAGTTPVRSLPPATPGGRSGGTRGTTPLRSAGHAAAAAAAAVSTPLPTPVRPPAVGAHTPAPHSARPEGTPPAAHSGSVSVGGASDGVDPLATQPAAGSRVSSQAASAPPIDPTVVQLPPHAGAGSGSQATTPELAQLYGGSDAGLPGVPYCDSAPRAAHTDSVPTPPSSCAAGDDDTGPPCGCSNSSNSSNSSNGSSDSDLCAPPTTDNDTGRSRTPAPSRGSPPPAARCPAPAATSTPAAVAPSITSPLIIVSTLPGDLPPGSARSTGSTDRSAAPPSLPPPLPYVGLASDFSALLPRVLASFTVPALTGSHSMRATIRAVFRDDSDDDAL